MSTHDMCIDLCTRLKRNVQHTEQPRMRHRKSNPTINNVIIFTVESRKVARQANNALNNFATEIFIFKESHTQLAPDIEL